LDQGVLLMGQVSSEVAAPDLRAWRARAVALMALLEAHGAEDHRVRADLAQGEFQWLDPEGRVSASSTCLALATWSPQTRRLTMAWADPSLALASVAAVPGIPDEQPDADEEQAFLQAMIAAERSSLEFVYRLVSGSVSTFLALSVPRFASSAPHPSPSAPVAGILADLASLRLSLASPEGSLEGICSRLGSLGSLLCERARSTYDGSDWVARLERSGRRLERLAESWALARERCSMRKRAQGASAALSAGELDRALQLLEDEWRAFVAGQRS
jgi:hypothetical protein